MDYQLPLPPKQRNLVSFHFRAIFSTFCSTVLLRMNDACPLLCSQEERGGGEGMKKLL